MGKCNYYFKIIVKSNFVNKSINNIKKECIFIINLFNYCFLCLKTKKNAIIVHLLNVICYFVYTISKEKKVGIQKHCYKSALI